MIHRWMESHILESLKFIEVTAVIGPRQAGKTTLCQSIALRHRMPFISMDDPQHLHYASTDPKGFIEEYPMAFIDEIQRAPELLLPLKYSVDQDHTHGRYLISGSVDLWRSLQAPDSLAGRMHIIKLLPLARGEILAQPPSSLITEAFQGKVTPIQDQTPCSLQELAHSITQGGYPKIQIYPHQRQRRTWLRSHMQLVAEHDLPRIEDVRKKERFTELIRYLALHPAQQIHLATCASALRITTQTIQRWLALLENMFLIQRLPAWHQNRKKRITKSPKYHFLDTGLLCALQDHAMTDTMMQDPASLGPLLENYVLTELSKMMAAMEEDIFLYHYRDYDGYEVDFVLEYGTKVIGIEVKAKRSVMPKDFAGLRRLKDVCGDDFICGMILHRADHVERRENNLFSVPLQKLWQGSTG